MSQTDKKESLITNIREIKQEIKTLIVNYIKDQQIEIVSTLEKDIEIIEHKENDYVYQTLPVIIDINAYRIIFDIYQLTKRPGMAEILLAFSSFSCLHHHNATRH